MIRLFIVIIFMANALAGQAQNTLKNLEVTATGQNLQQAIYNGLNLAAAQIYGVTPAQISEQTGNNYKFISLGQDNKPQIHDITQNINAITSFLQVKNQLGENQNLINSFQIIGQKTGNNGTEVTLRVEYYEFQAINAQNYRHFGKLKLAIAPVIVNDNAVKIEYKADIDLRKTFTRMLSDNLLASGRFTLLERGDAPLAANELSIIASGLVAKQYQKNLGQIIPADWIVVMEIMRFEWNMVEKKTSIISDNSTKTRGKLVAHIRIINPSTLEYISSKTHIINASFQDKTKDNIAGESDDIADNNNQNIHLDKFIANAMSQLSNNISEEFYPTRIMAMKNNIVTINRGRARVKLGEIWAVKANGVSMIDPDTNDNIQSEGPILGKMVITKLAEHYAEGEFKGDISSINGQSWHGLRVVRAEGPNEEPNATKAGNNNSNNGGIPNFLTRDYLKTTP